MNPQPGEYWMDRNGRVVGPLLESGLRNYTLSDEEDTWTRKGSFLADIVKSEYDLVEKVGGPKPSHDAVNHPVHYTSHPAGIECIQVTEHMTFNLGNVVKYVWRFDGKGGVQDLKKAAWYLQREIERLERDNETST